MANDKVYVVTGATSGIGFATAVQLADRNGQVIGIARTDERAAEALSALPPDLRPRIQFEVADLASLKQVRRLALRLRSRLGRLDALVNNAGVFSSRRVLTEDGFELTFQVSHLAHFALTLDLWPLLAVSSGRVITV